jgi:Ca-activated chloride channel family protein
MAALDFQPQNRLEAARAVIGQFIEQRPFDRIGLVVFAREAFGHSPISVDHVVLDRQLDQVRLAAELGLEDGTAIGLGLANAANMLRASEAESRIVILLTDGANNSGQIDPRTAAEAAASLGIRCYTIGMGRPGQVPVPVPGPFGDRIVYQESDLDEPTLQAIAETTGGLYFRAEDRRGLEEIYAQIDQLEKSKVEISQMTRYRELAAWALLPALLLLAGCALLGAGPLRTLP